MSVGELLAIASVVGSFGMLVAELRAARASIKDQGSRLGALAEKIWYAEGYRAREREEVQRAK